MKRTKDNYVLHKIYYNLYTIIRKWKIQQYGK